MLSLRGELDLSTVSVVEDELVVAQESHQLVVMDLRNLSFMDSTGLRVIVMAEQRARALSRRLVIVQGPPQVQRVLELTGVIGWLDVLADPSSVLG